MIFISDFLKKSVDLIDEGLIVVDNTGKIKVYNREAAAIFGIDPRIGPGHESGKINKGDIVLIADNALGRDDGNLGPEDLAELGVESSDFEKDDSFILIGKKSGQKEEAYYKKTEYEKGLLSMEKKILNRNIKVEINFEKKLLQIKVDEKNYPFYYSIAAGNLVILNGKTGKVKFYQTRGYTARKEDIRSILKEKKYIRKGPQGEVPKIFDKHISSYHPDSHIIKRLLEIAKGEENGIKNQEAIINGVPTRCTMTSITEKDKVIGAMLKVEDIRELKTIIAERDKALNSKNYLENQLNKREQRDEAFKKILGASEKFEKAKKMAYKASESISNVLLLGESGTGKNLFAKAIHDASQRKNEEFVYINCASIPENLFESELFGYEKGSFTGALDSGKEGKLEKANKGTLFLDEIAELPLSLQAKFLHFLQSRKYTRVGGLEEKEVDVRFVFATNKDLENQVRKGEFREDLYFRINVLPIYLPPLRERREDIPLLVNKLLSRINKKLSKNIKEISSEAMKYLMSYEWKGNIRELENVLERAINICDNELIRVDDLPSKVIKQFSQDQRVKIQGIGSLEKTVEEAEKELIKKVLEYTDGSRKKAIKILGIGKTSFYERLKKYNL
mgnify:CR=1 FL=1